MKTRLVLFTWLDVHQLIKNMGFKKMIVGHEPALLESPDEVAINSSSWFMKIDAGIKKGKEGGLVHCRLKPVHKEEWASAFPTAGGKPLCVQVRLNGAEEAIPLKN